MPKRQTLAEIWIKTYPHGVRQARLSELMSTAGYAVQAKFMDHFEVRRRCEVTELSSVLAWAGDELWAEIRKGAA